MSQSIYTAQRELRRAFWDHHPRLDVLARAAGRRNKPQNDQPADVRMAWVFWVDGLEKAGDITEALAQRATL